MSEDRDVARRRLGVRDVRASGLGFALALARARAQLGGYRKTVFPQLDQRNGDHAGKRLR